MLYDKWLNTYTEKSFCLRISLSLFWKNFSLSVAGTNPRSLKFEKYLLFSFTLTSQHREQLKLLILLGKGSKLKCLLNFSAKSEGWLSKCIKKTSKYFTYSHWSHLQLWVPTAFTNHDAITPRWASKKNQTTGLCSLNNVTQKHRKKVNQKLVCLSQEPASFLLAILCLTCQISFIF